jgi:transketolase
VPAVTPEGAALETGRATELRAGTDVTVIAIGTLVSRALDAADRLAEDGISVRVVNTPFVHPLDEQTVLAAARETRCIVTAEEGTLSGGLGAAVATTVAQHAPVPMRMLGVPGVFAPTGDADFLLSHFGLTADGIVSAVKDVLVNARR